MFARSRHRWRGSCFLPASLATVAVMHTCALVSAADGIAVDSLLDHAPHWVNLHATVDPMARQGRLVNVRRESLEAVTSGDRLELALFDGLRLDAVFEQKSSRETGYTWTGTLAETEPGGWFVLSVEGDALVGTFWRADGSTYDLRPAAEGVNVYLLQELEPAQFPPCTTCETRHLGGIGQLPGKDETPTRHAPSDDPAPIGGGEAGTGVTCGPDDGSLIDVLVLYTPAARSSAGGTNAMIALINNAVASTNNAYANSQIDTRLRLVHAAETNYSESGSFNTDLSRLRGINNGYMDEAHVLRNQYGADLVALLNEASGSCGVGYLMTNLSTGFASSAFSVTWRACAVGNLTFAHELGHNMGCAHDRDNAGGALFSYSYGYRWTTTGGSLRRSVMAYSPGNRVAHFSNPNVNNGGVPTGITPGLFNAAANAISINNAAETIANFRQSICEGPANNTCSQTTLLGQGSFPFSNIAATTSGPDESAECTGGSFESDVWFGHIAQCTGELTVSLCGTEFPAVVAVYDFPCPTEPGTMIECATTACGASQLTIPVVQGVGYRIRIGGIGGAQGDGLLTLSCQATCTGDLTNSGSVAVADMLALLAAWGECAGDCPEDLNGDDLVNVADLLALLSLWGPCPD